MSLTVSPELLDKARRGPVTDDEFINTNPQVGAGRGSAYNLYRRAR